MASISDIQRALQAAGFDPKGIDGDLGPATKAALEAFQKARGLAVTGVPDVPTVARLTGPPPSAITGPPENFQLDKTSERNLVGVHPSLVLVVRRADELTAVPFRVIEGCRTLARQKQLVAKGASQTLRSRHIPGGHPSYGHAVDLVALVGGTVRWDWPLYPRIAAAVKQAAHDVGVPIEWGGDWKTFKDGPHFQLPWASYPA